MLIPYPWLSDHPQKIVLCDKVPVYFNLSTSGGRDCIVTLSNSHSFEMGKSISVPVGTSFELEYKGVVNEIHLGRWLLVCDA
jgi:hypothetical protein